MTLNVKKDTDCSQQLINFHKYQIFIPANTLCKAYFLGEFNLMKAYEACSSISAERRSQSSDVIRIKMAAASPKLPICFKHSQNIMAQRVAASGSLNKNLRR